LTNVSNTDTQQSKTIPTTTTITMSAVPTFSGAPPPKYQKPNTNKGFKKHRSSSSLKRKGGSSSSSASSSSSSSQRSKATTRGGGFRDAWVSVQALGATQLQGWERRAWEADAFEALGGKKQRRETKMPNRMRMGIMKKRKKVDERREERERKADLVNGKKKKGGQRERDKKRKQSTNGKGEYDPIASRVGNAGGGSREQFRNGVMRITNVFAGNDKKRRKRR
jgi:hypothetical protein